MLDGVSKWDLTSALIIFIISGISLLPVLSQGLSKALLELRAEMTSAAEQQVIASASIKEESLNVQMLVDRHTKDLKVGQLYHNYMLVFHGCCTLFMNSCWANYLTQRQLQLIQKIFSMKKGKIEQLKCHLFTRWNIGNISWCLWSMLIYSHSLCVFSVSEM